MEWSRVPSRRRSGGLALLWKNDVLLNTQIVSPNHIGAYVSYPMQVQWRLTGIYGHPEEQRKCETWHLMRHLYSYTSLPWLCIGDFNEMLSSDEKNGRIPKPLGLMQAFSSTLLHWRLVDLGYSGKIFTWRNGRQELEFVEERLDRVCANTAWSKLFPRARVEHLNVVYSDHDPIQLNLDNSSPQIVCREHLQRFEEKWVPHTECEDRIRTSWA